MFWGLVVKDDKQYSHTVESAFHISNACIEKGSVSGNEEVDLMVKVGGEHYLLCTLSSKVFQYSLDLNFSEGETVVFYTRRGKGHIHLTGYNLDENEEMSDLELDTTADDSVIIPKKIQLGKPAKAAELKKKAEEANAEEDSEDEEDSDFNLGSDESEDEEEEAEEEEEEEDEEDSEDSDEEEATAGLFDLGKKFGSPKKQQNAKQKSPANKKPDTQAQSPVKKFDAQTPQTEGKKGKGTPLFGSGKKNKGQGPFPQSGGKKNKGTPKFTGGKPKGTPGGDSSVQTPSQSAQKKYVSTPYPFHGKDTSQQETSFGSPMSNGLSASKKKKKNKNKKRLSETSPSPFGKGAKKMKAEN